MEGAFIKRAIILTAIAAVLILAECKPVPEAPLNASAKAWTERDVDDWVVMEEVLIPSAAPLNPLINSAPPEPCNYIHFLRFRLKNENEKPSEKTRQVIIDSTSADSVICPAADQKMLLSWVLFNLPIGNMDEHAKNLSICIQKRALCWRLFTTSFRQQYTQICMTGSP
jgi:hypothetical protein